LGHCALSLGWPSVKRNVART